MFKHSIGKWVAAALVAGLGGCAVVPYGPPVYVGVHADGYGGHGYGRGPYRGSYYDGGYYRGGRY